MSKVILPEFGALESKAAAEAFSEYFVDPENFGLYVPRGNTRPAATDINALAAIGVNYLSDDGQVAFGYVMGSQTPTPLETASAFVENYDRDTTGQRKKIEWTRSKTGEFGLGLWRHKVIERAKRDSIRTLAAYALFHSQEVGYAGGLIAADSVAIDLPLEGRETVMSLEHEASGLFEVASAMAIAATGTSKEKMDQARQRIIRNEDGTSFGLLMASMDMPPVRILKEILSMSPQIGNFFELPRKERRALLRDEQKSLRRQTS